MIAASAAVNELVLVTSSLPDFRRFEGLRVEDWRRVSPRGVGES